MSPPYAVTRRVVVKATADGVVLADPVTGEDWLLDLAADYANDTVLLTVSVMERAYRPPRRRPIGLLPGKRESA